MVEQAARTADRWVDGGPIDVSAEMMRLTLAIVGRTLFDVDIESKADRVGSALTAVLETFWLALPAVLRKSSRRCRCARYGHRCRRERISTPRFTKWSPSAAGTRLRSAAICCRC